MAYEPTDWKDGPAGQTPITSADLKRMEQAIVDFDKVLSGFTTIVTSWKWMGDALLTPKPGEMSGNVQRAVNATTIAVNDIALDKRNFIGLMRMVTTTSKIYLQAIGNPDAWLRYNITSVLGHTSDYTKFGVTVGAQGITTPILPTGQTSVDVSLVVML